MAGGLRFWSVGSDLGFNGGGWPIWVVVGLVIFGLRSGFRCVDLVFWWLRSRLVVFGLRFGF